MALSHHQLSVPSHLSVCPMDTGKQAHCDSVTCTRALESGYRRGGGGRDHVPKALGVSALRPQQDALATCAPWVPGPLHCSGSNRSQVPGVEAPQTSPLGHEVPVGLCHLRSLWRHVSPWALPSHTSCSGSQDGGATSHQTLQALTPQVQLWRQRASVMMLVGLCDSGLLSSPPMKSIRTLSCG